MPTTTSHLSRSSSHDAGRGAGDPDFSAAAFVEQAAHNCHLSHATHIQCVWKSGNIINVRHSPSLTAATTAATHRRQADPEQAKQRRRCQRAWTFERVAGYEMKTKPRRRLKSASKEACMEACLLEHEFACRSANWHRATGECSLHDQDRHSVSQSEAGDQRIKASVYNFYGPQSSTSGSSNSTAALGAERAASFLAHQQHYFSSSAGLLDRSRLIGQTPEPAARRAASSGETRPSLFKQLFRKGPPEPAQAQLRPGRQNQTKAADWPASMQQHYVELLGDIQVDYLENNCIYEPNKLCEFRKIQNRVLKTVDSIYQDVATLEECRQKCLNAPYRCYSFDYGDTSERVCRTSHLDQASLMSVSEPYLEVAGAITYELAACFNVSIQCRARGMVAQVSSSKSFNGKLYAKSRPASCQVDVSNSLQFELHMNYHDDACDVRASSSQAQGVFSNDIIIQHHDSIVTTQDVGLSVYCQYDLGNRSVTNNVDLAIERLPDGPMESKQQQSTGGVVGASPSGPLTITSLATTVVKSPNVTMRITNMDGQPVTSATVGDRLALLFEIKEKTSEYNFSSDPPPSEFQVPSSALPRNCSPGASQSSETRVLTSDFRLALLSALFELRRSRRPADKELAGRWPIGARCASGQFVEWLDH